MIKDSLIAEYFDFSQALKFLKDGHNISEKNLHNGWFYMLDDDDNSFYIVSPDRNTYKHEFSTEDLLLKTYFIYGEVIK